MSLLSPYNPSATLNPILDPEPRPQETDPRLGGTVDAFTCHFEAALVGFRV